MQSALAPLLQPGRIGSLQVRNRIVVPPMQSGRVKDWVPTWAMTEGLAAHGRGGAGLIFSEGCGLDHPSSFSLPALACLTPRSLSAWREVVEAVHATGASIFIQLWHPGAARESEPGSPTADYPTLSASGLAAKDKPAGRAMTSVELDEVREAYGVAAERVKAIGADGVEIHAGHGYILDSFLWSATNLRDDDYGGSTLAERSRYPAEIVQTVRAAVGPDFPISLRFSQFKGGNYDAKIVSSPEELRTFLGLFRGAGVDCFHVSTRRIFAPAWPELDDRLPLAGFVSSMTDAAVIAVGSMGLQTDLYQTFTTPMENGAFVVAHLEKAAQLVSDGWADFIAIGRGQIANTDLVEKMKQGRIDELVSFDKARHLPNV